MRRRIGIALFIATSGLAGSAPADDVREHLPFFRANRDWVLRAFEALPRPTADPDAAARAWSFDPFADATARARLAGVEAALDSAASLGDLGTFRSALDSLLAEAVAMGGRLDDLDQRFAAHLRTAVEVTLAAKSGLAVERVEAWLEGACIARHELDDAERAALAAGGVLEVVRRVVEPRAQAIEIAVYTRGAAEPSRTAWTLEPVPDALSVCHLDLENARAPARRADTLLEGRN